MDDDPEVRTVATVSLERAGFRVVAACDGEDGVALFRERSSEFDALLLDMTMPRLSGVETCHLLKKVRPISQSS